MHIACVGGDRFTIAELHDDEPYITASIGRLDDDRRGQNAGPFRSG